VLYSVFIICDCLNVIFVIFLCISIFVYILLMIFLKKTAMGKVIINKSELFMMAHVQPS
jgi:hypothetical protein